MSTLISKASLLLVPSVYEDGTLYNVLPSGNKAPDETGNHNGYDQTRADFTFSRGSNLAATRVNADGLIEKGRENLLLQSNSFSTSPWVSNNLTLTSGQVDKDGGANAWLLDITAGTNSQRLEQDIVLSSIATFSIYVKAGTLNWVRLRTDGATTRNNYFDLENGVIGTTSGIDAKIEDVGNNWFRCSVVTDDVTRVRIYPADADGDVTHTSGSIYIQSAQLEKGLVSTPYIETGATTATAGVLENTPRIDYSSGAGALLLEPQRTNGVANSEYIGGWNSIQSGITLTANYGISPEGVRNSTRIQFSGASLELRDTTSVAAGNMSSIYIKGTNGETIKFGSNGAEELFTLNGEWQRIEKYNATAATKITINTYSGATARDIEVYGAMQEAGSHVSSYVPTYGSAATRGADIVDGKEDSSLYNDSEGVLFVEFSALSATRDNEFRFMISDGTNDDRIQIGLQTGGDLYASVIESNSATASFNYTLPNPTQTHKVAIKYKANDCALWVDGIERGTDISATMPSGLDIFDFYRTPNNNNYVEANVKQVIYFDEALSDSELATLTTL